MKIFLDTNVVMEFFGNRIFFEDCRRIMEAAFQGGIDACMSAGRVYTITYLLGIDLKKKNIHEPNETEMVREMLHDLLKNYIWGTGYFLWVRLLLSQYSEYSEHEEGNIVDTSQVSPKDFYL
jgi:hypothetical protein